MNFENIMLGKIKPITKKTYYMTDPIYMKLSQLKSETKINDCLGLRTGRTNGERPVTG